MTVDLSITAPTTTRRRSGSRDGGGAIKCASEPAGRAYRHKPLEGGLTVKPKVDVVHQHPPHWRGLSVVVPLSGYFIGTYYYLFAVVGMGWRKYGKEV